MMTTIANDLHEMPAAVRPVNQYHLGAKLDRSSEEAPHAPARPFVTRPPEGPLGLIDRLSGRDELAVENDRLRREVRLLKARLAPGADAPSTDAPTTRTDLVERFAAIAAALAGQEELEATLRMIVGATLELTGGARAYLILAEGDRLRFRLGLDRSGAELPEEGFSVSRTIAEEVARTGNALTSSNAASSHRLAAIESVRRLDLRSVMCLPLRHDGASLGSVWVDDPDRPAAFGPDEEAIAQALTDLASVVLDRIRGAARRLRDERVRSVGLAASHLLHDLAGPLAVVRLMADRFDEETPAERTRAQCDRIQAMVQDVLDLVRGEVRLRLERIDASDLLADLARSVGIAAERRGVALSLDDALDAPIRADAGRLLRALENLVRNALVALEGVEDPAVEVILAPVGADRVAITVADNGPGIPAARRGTLFEPFVGGEAGGAGLGLNVSEWTATDAGGASRRRAIIRGGSWANEDPVAAARTDRTDVAFITDRRPWLGFRCAASID